ncbi:hypothetical protein EV424DRAFT_1538983 [Suillus variegatus]|nr:hypothetical protein EV424DRAFT_1538983 [Suillus variegatus]
MKDIISTIYPDAAAAPNRINEFDPSPIGTAVEALPHMHAILNSRPEGFDSVEEAIEWQYVFGAVLPSIRALSTTPLLPVVPTDSPLTLSTRANIGFKYKWRTPLRSTAPYWDIAQMRSKFWLEVMAGSGVGHLVHENDPTKLAEILADFWR